MDICIALDRGWIVIRVLSIVLDRINCIVFSCARITWYMLSNTRNVLNVLHSSTKLASIAFCITATEFVFVYIILQ